MRVSLEMARDGVCGLLKLRLHEWHSVSTSVKLRLHEWHSISTPVKGR